MSSNFESNNCVFVGDLKAEINEKWGQIMIKFILRYIHNDLFLLYRYFAYNHMEKGNPEKLIVYLEKMYNLKHCSPDQRDHFSILKRSFLRVNHHEPL
jgi:hypothetical protein